MKNISPQDWRYYEDHKDGSRFYPISGNKRWYKDGLLHRENGPAIEYKNGPFMWYLNGVYLKHINSQKEFEKYMKLQGFW